MHPDDKSRIWNRWWRLENLYWIQTKKAGKKVKFKVNPVQRIMAKYIRYWHLFLILKARQAGVSTFFLLLHLDATLFTENCTTVILAHRKDSLKKLFRIIKIAYESCPDSIQLADGTVWHKPKAKYDNVNELYFEDLDSRIYVALEVRSDTVHRLHVSEWAHIKKADDVLTATLGAVVDGGFVSGETTANGMGGSFYESWGMAVDGESDYIALFFGYQDHPDYCDHVPDIREMEESLSDEEKQLMTVPNMKLGNIAWRRRQLRDPAKRKKFKQEFPCTAEEAFITSGKSPFDRERILDWIIRKPIETKMEDRLSYWIKPIAERKYVIGVDCASGMGTEVLDPESNEREGGTDYSVITVWDCQTLQLCAMFRAKWSYIKLHEIVYKLGKEYNLAYVAVEATDHGLTVLSKLTETDYPKSLIHTTEQLDHKSKRMTTKWGWYTNAKTKPLIIDHLAGLIEDELIKPYSRKMQSEFLKFITNDKGQYEAMEGYKDDCVMGSAIPLYLVPNALRAMRQPVTLQQLGM
jgi:hypothetical protein